MMMPLWKRLCALCLSGGLGLLLLGGGWGVLQRPVLPVAANQNCTLPPVPSSPSKVGLYVLAFDNDPRGSFDLGTKYTDTVDGLVEATTAVPGSIVVILADLGGVGDTHLIIGARGVQTRVDCLPTAAGTLDPTLRELDVADGEALANFLVWGRETFATASSGVVFSYIGHGSPVVPYTEPGIDGLIPPAGEGEGDARPRVPHTLSPLPSRLGVNPSFTDHHAPTTGTLSLISPHALATALAAATDDGANPFDLVDLLHCFAATIDELVEIAPYAGGIIASPNYAFFDPGMPGATFEQSALFDVLITYDSFHPISGHPHILMGVEADTISDITNGWQMVTDELLAEFERDEQGTADRLLAAYQNSVKYDTTFCEEDQDWALEPPDALSDMMSLAAEMQITFSGQSPTLTAALSETMDRLDKTILVSVAQSGEPYFNEGSGKSWQFLPDKGGIAVFTPFQTAEIEGERYLPWQSLWYTETKSYSLTSEVVIENPQPFTFITDSGQSTWADVVARFWRVEQMRPGVDVNTFFCTAALLGMRGDAADLGLTVDSSAEMVQKGDELQLTLTVSNQDTVTATETMLYFEPHVAPVSWLMLQESNLPSGCQRETQTVVCALGDLPPLTEQGVVLTYDVAVEALLMPFMLQMKAEAAAATFEPTMADNQQLLTVEVLSTGGRVYLPLVVDQ